MPHTVTFINTELKDSMDPAGTDIVEPHKSLNMIFTGRAGGFMGKFVKLIKVRGVEYAPIKIEIADDLSY